MIQNALGHFGRGGLGVHQTSGGYLPGVGTAAASRPASAEDGMPPLPHAFYGTLLVDEEPAPSGTLVTAEVQGQVCGSITTKYPGKYGSDENGNFGPGIEKLIVQGDIDDGAIVEFYVETVKADQTYPFTSGNVTQLN